MNRLVCWFSCGAASALATKFALQQFAGREIIIARCIVKEEHPDNDRFAADCEAWFGMPITNLTSEKYSGSIYEVFRKRGYIAGIHGAPCTLHLKKDVRIAFERPTDTQVFGYCQGEEDRWDRFLDANNIAAHSPLIERGITHSEALAVVQRAGLRLPAMYAMGYQHNNCIGCVKGGAGYWNKIRRDFPAQFNRMADTSRAMGVRMIKLGEERIFLDELPIGAGRYEDEPEVQCGIFCEAATNEISES